MNINMIRKFPKVEEFKALIAVNFDEMQSDRVKCTSDSEFWSKYGVSYNTVRKFMWPSWKWTGWLKTIQLDRDEVNALRLEYSDKYLANKYGCSAPTITAICGTRSSLLISRIPKEKKSYKKIEVKKIWLNTDRWDNAEEKPYWMTDDVVISGSSPMSGIKLEENKFWHPY